jgi:hypothetical protein
MPLQRSVGGRVLVISCASAVRRRESNQGGCVLKKSTWYTSHEILGLKHHSSAYKAFIRHLWMPCMRGKSGLSTLRHAHQVRTPIIRPA